MAEDIPKTGHDIKHILVYLFEQHIDFGGFAFDSAVAAYLCNPATGKYELERIAAAYLDCELPPAAYAADGAFSPLSDMDAELLSAAAHLAAVSRLREVLSAKLEEQGMTKLMFDMELPLTEVLAYMQYIGFRVDKSASSNTATSLPGASPTLKTPFTRRRAGSSTSTPRNSSAKCSLKSWACRPAKRPNPATRQISTRSTASSRSIPSAACSSNTASSPSSNRRIRTALPRSSRPRTAASTRASTSSRRPPAASAPRSRTCRISPSGRNAARSCGACSSRRTAGCSSTRTIPRSSCASSRTSRTTPA